MGQPVLTLPALEALIKKGDIDTIIMAAPDMQGRLQGKRVMPRYFLEHLAAGALEGCAYLLATDVESQPIAGYEFMSLDKGYGDFALKPDLTTLRLATWLNGTAIILCDIRLLPDHQPVCIAPRTILQNQLDRLHAMGLTALAATELEFLLFKDNYETAWDKAYRGLTPANQYNSDYSILGTSKVEPIIRRIRNAMEMAGIQVENSKGECNFGQHEINFRYAPALTTCDNHVIFKEAAKEIAAEAGQALTFMAKFNEREGNSCHTHLSLQNAQGQSAFLDADGQSASRLLGQFIAGLIRHAPELMIFYAPNINSYKRFVSGSFAPTALAWGMDNRTCAFRVLGHGESFHIENRIPGGDVNPYLALAAMIASGLAGIEKDYEPVPMFSGNAYQSTLPRGPQSLVDALPLFAQSELAKASFGAEIVSHYTNMARVEIDAFNASVTDWEKFRGFERM